MVKMVVFLVFSALIAGCAGAPAGEDSRTYVFCGLDPEGLSRIDHYCMDGPNR